MHAKVDFFRFNCYKQNINNCHCSETSEYLLSKLAVFILYYELKPRACTLTVIRILMFVINNYNIVTPKILLAQGNKIQLERVVFSEKLQD